MNLDIIPNNIIDILTTSEDEQHASGLPGIATIDTALQRKNYTLSVACSVS